MKSLAIWDTVSFSISLFCYVVDDKICWIVQGMWKEARWNPKENTGFHNWRTRNKKEAPEVAYEDNSVAGAGYDFQHAMGKDESFPYSEHWGDKQVKIMLCGIWLVFSVFLSRVLPPHIVLHICSNWYIIINNPCTNQPCWCADLCIMGLFRKCVTVCHAFVHITFTCTLGWAVFLILEGKASLQFCVSPHNNI